MLDLNLVEPAVFGQISGPTPVVIAHATSHVGELTIVVLLAAGAKLIVAFVAEPVALFLFVLAELYDICTVIFGKKCKVTIRLRYTSSCLKSKIFGISSIFHDGLNLLFSCYGVSDVRWTFELMRRVLLLNHRSEIFFEALMTKCVITFFKIHRAII